MSTLMLVSTLLLAALVSLSGSRLLRTEVDPAARGRLALWSLAVPAAALVTCSLSLLPYLARIDFLCGDCSEGVVAAGLLAFLAVGFLLALLLGLVRPLLLAYTLRRRLRPAPEDLRLRADELAARMGGRRAEVSIVPSPSPVAFTYGLLRPRVVLSTWLLENLDGRELEGALAHELAHAAARDHRTLWAATLLRDATFYLPWAWQARRALVSDRELVADDTAASVTGRPLALAGALAKVWQGSLATPAARLWCAPQLSEVGSRVEMRIARLLDEAGAPQQDAKPLAPPRLNLAAALAVGLVAVCLVA